MQYCTLFFVCVCFACVYPQLERILVLRCCSIYLDDFFSFPYSFLLKDGHIGPFSAYTCTETQHFPEQRQEN